MKTNQEPIGHSYTELTQEIEVEVRPLYLEEESRPELSQYLFKYDVTIYNHSPSSIQLISRHWIITDGNGRIEEVKGPGVIGEQPIIPPGKSYSYSSFCPIPTPTGNMRGSYQIVTSDNQRLEIRIPLFFLRSDMILH
jgi:ApaG protein